MGEKKGGFGGLRTQFLPRVSILRSEQPVSFPRGNWAVDGPGGMRAHATRRFRRLSSRRRRRRRRRRHDHRRRRASCLLSFLPCWCVCCQSCCCSAVGWWLPHAQMRAMTGYIVASRDKSVPYHSTQRSHPAPSSLSVVCRGGTSTRDRASRAANCRTVRHRQTGGCEA